MQTRTRVAAPARHPLVIGHRGASGYRPEHTAEAYRLAAKQGAASVEPDLVMTADGVLIVRHENELSRSTDVAQRPKFAHRRCTRTVGHAVQTGWFSEDFTVAEIRTLQPRERHPSLRAASAAWHGRTSGVLTFDEVLQLAQGLGIGVHAELKNPAHFTARGLDPVGAVARAMRHHASIRSIDVRLMCFEPTALQALRTQVSIPLIQLLDRGGYPEDATHRTQSTSFAALAGSLREVATWADAVGAHKNLVLPRCANEAIDLPSTLVPRAHQHGLEVLVWTLRAENQHLPRQARRGVTPGDYGSIDVEVNALVRAGVDGLLTDHPDQVVRALAARSSR